MPVAATTFAAMKNLFGQRFQGATEGIVDSTLAWALAEFLTHSTVWRVDGSTTLVDGQRDYPLAAISAFPDAVPHMLLGCAYATGQPLTLVPSVHLAPDRIGRPSQAVLAGGSVLRVWPTPGPGDVGVVLRARVALVTDPGTIPNTIPADVLPFMAIVQMFAESEFLSMRGRPWSDKPQADLRLRRAKHGALAAKAVADGGRGKRTHVQVPPRSGM